MPPGPGLWSAQHRKLAIWGWLAFVFIALAIGTAVGTRALEHTEGSVGESGRADQAIADAAPEYAQEMVLIQSASATAGQPQFRAVVADVQRRLEALPDTQNFENPYDPAHGGQISADGHSALLRYQLAGKDSDVMDSVKPAVAAVDATQEAHPGFTLGEFGDASTNEQINKVVTDDFGKALKTSLPFTLIILLLAFGALVAAAIPLLLALTAVMATIGIMGPVSHLIGGVDTSINEVILLIGLAVGVDYSMFYLRREREEREAGRSEECVAGRRGGDLRACGDGLRLHGDDRDGRDVLRRDAHVRVVRHRHHPGRRRGSGRLADGAAGDPLVARRPGGEGRGADHQGPAVERRGEQALEPRS